MPQPGNRVYDIKNLGPNQTTVLCYRCPLNFQPELSFFIQSWTGWSPTRPLDEGPETPSILRRRIDPVGQTALQAGWGVHGMGAPRYILSSRHGEFRRTLRILESVIEKEEVSPADFSLSVHHALVGLLSIAKGNDKGHGALAAGSESLFLAMIEAYACLQENPEEDILLIHYDEPLMGAFEVFKDPHESPIVMAMLLSSHQGMGICLYRETVNGPGRMPSPICAAQAFLTFLDQADQRDLTWCSESSSWTWRRYG